MRHFVFSDIHGNRDLFDEIKNFLAELTEDYQVICLGDVADRGKSGYGMIKEVLADPHFIYLKGNHEDIFVKSAYEFMDICRDMGVTPKELVKSQGDYDSVMMLGENMRLHRMNGGLSTFRDWVKDGAPLKLIADLKKLPLFYQYKNYDFCHAGCVMAEWDNKEEEPMLWSRNHFLADWFEGRILVHGHTAVCNLPEWVLKHSNCKRRWIPTQYNNGSKIDLDTASAFTDVISLYDLDGLAAITLTEDPGKVYWDNNITN